jgi:hypothetical protein
MDGLVSTAAAIPISAAKCRNASQSSSSASSVSLYHDPHSFSLMSSISTTHGLKSGIEDLISGAISVGSWDGVIGRSVAKPAHTCFSNGLRLGRDAATMPTSTSICDQAGTQAQFQLMSPTHQVAPFGVAAITISHNRIMLAMRGTMPTENMTTSAAAVQVSEQRRSGQGRLAYFFA